MSRMADLALDIEEALVAGEPVASVARRLNVPVSWVNNIEEQLLFNNYEDAVVQEMSELAQRISREEQDY